MYVDIGTYCLSVCLLGVCCHRHAHWLCIAGLTQFEWQKNKISKCVCVCVLQAVADVKCTGWLVHCPCPD